jgi:DNA mismatch repair ATPase MutS
VTTPTTDSRSASSIASVLYRGGVSPQLDSVVPVSEDTTDLLIDELIEQLVIGRERSDLESLFRTPLADPDDVVYRQEVFRDLEDPVLRAGITSFVGAMQGVAEGLDHASGLRFRRHRERLLLEAIDSYVRAVDSLAATLDVTVPRSRGLRAISEHLSTYRASTAFRAMTKRATDLLEALSGLTYRLRIGVNRITVSQPQDEPDHGAEIVAAFERFRSVDAPQRPPPDVYVTNDLTQIEVAILERVAGLYPDLFALVADFARDHGRFIDPTLARFERDVQFYLAYLNLVEPIREAGLDICHPTVSTSSMVVRAHGIYDLALALRRSRDGRMMVTSDVELAHDERVVVVTGPNQGGKTSFARAIGQTHHLASIGCPVPATDATVPLVDAVYTHFDRLEDPAELSGRLESDLRQIASRLHVATARSLIVMNESFASTTVDDAIQLTRAVLGRITAKGARVIIVTFLYELASDERVVSFAAARDGRDETRSTYRMERRRPDGLAHAAAVADKYRLGREAIRRRFDR